MVTCVTMEFSDIQLEKLSDICICIGQVALAGAVVPFFLGNLNLTAGLLGLTVACVSWILGIRIIRDVL